MQPPNFERPQEGHCGRLAEGLQSVGPTTNGTIHVHLSLFLSAGSKGRRTIQDARLGLVEESFLQHVNTVHQVRSRSDWYVRSRSIQARRELATLLFLLAGRRGLAVRATIGGTSTKHARFADCPVSREEIAPSYHGQPLLIHKAVRENVLDPDQPGRLRYFWI